jgi:hypothetical protein
MSPLHKALQGWRGPGIIQRLLRDTGYSAHTVYRNCIVDYCKSKCLAIDLDIYWEEIAKEYVSSAGSAFDLGRHRNTEGYYRSPYLDRLQMEAQNLISKFSTLPSVHPCIHEYMSELEFGDRSLYSRIRKKVEEKKVEECLTHGISGTQWSGYKRGLNLVLDEVAELRGFEIIGSRGIHSELPTITYGLRARSGLLFYFHADNGAGEPLAARLPIDFWIGYEKVTRDDFFVADFRHVIPGFEQYAYYSTPKSAVLGIRALLGAFDALARSF